MKGAQKPDHVSLTGLVDWIGEGRFVIPDFQREFEWKPWDINELMRSIFLDYYIGSLLLWKGREDSFDALSCEPIYGYLDEGKRAQIVLDGQQRLTAMHYTFFAPDVSLPNRVNRFLFYIRVDRFMEEAYEDAFHYEWAKGWAKILENSEEQYSRHIFPLAVVGQRGWALSDWAKGYEKYWQERASGDVDAHAAEEAARHAENAREFGQHLKSIMEQYQIVYVELDEDLEVGKVCDIFTQANSKGVRLDVFDLINAMLKPKGLQLKYMFREALPRLNFVDTERMDVYVLQVMSILRQAYCSPKYLYYLLPGQERTIRDPDGTRRQEILVPDVRDFESRWSEAVDALETAINLLRHPQEFGAISSDYLPYVSILPVFSALQTEARRLEPKRQLDAQRKIRYWYWSSVFTNRYSGSVESTSARDFLDVREWFTNDAAAPAIISEFKGRFRSLDLRRETKRGSSVYNGVFNLLVLQGARDWMTGTVPQYGDLDDHHIVPKAWGVKNLSGSAIDTILNRTPLTAATNRHVINDRLPNQYLREMIEENGRERALAVLESHFVSSVAFDILLRDPFGDEDFEAFILERQRTIQEAIESLLIKERLDLAPAIRELDAQVEAAELALRFAVAEALEEDSSLLPDHVAQKIRERLQSAARKNPALDLAWHQTLSGALEFSDLRELEQAIVSKALWDRFADRFGSKEALAQRFGQLANLRNSIRHSRAVDEITRKDGEAAIAWVEQVLKR